MKAIENPAIGGKVSQANENNLIEKARNGDTRAFTQLVKRYEQMVYGFSYKVCRDKDKAEETLQDTFVNVYRKLDQFNGESKFSTWLYSIVTNNCLMKRRKRKLETEMISLDEPPVSQNHEPLSIPAWTDSPISSLMNSELRGRLDKAILKLPMEYRIVFMLRDVENQTAEETAKVLKLSVPAVKSRLRRARLFLRKELNDLMVE
jgi:RNA polymerase sigma-70 factor (ECF subfamily)